MLWVTGYFIEDQNALTPSVEGIEAPPKTSLMEATPASSQKAVPPNLPWELHLHIFSYASESVSSLAALCAVSKTHFQLLRPVLYASVVLGDVTSIALLRKTLVNAPHLGNLIHSLAIIGNSSPEEPKPSSDWDTQVPRNARSSATADRILQFCPKVRNLALDKDYCFDWSSGLYGMTMAREMTLIGVQSSEDFDGLTRQSHHCQPCSRFGVERLQLILVRPSSLGELYKLNLTHLVLTYPLLPPVPPGGLPSSQRIISRAHILLYLGDAGNGPWRTSNDKLERVIVRAGAATLAKIVDELRPIDDERLRFRIVKSRDAQHGANDKSVNVLQDWQVAAQTTIERVRREQVAAKRGEPQPDPHVNEAALLDSPWGDEPDDVLGATAQGWAWLDAKAREEAELAGEPLPSAQPLMGGAW